MTTTAPRRPAVTLVEVLIAIFLMGIGLMAILSLFPLGAAQMAQALKDQRCAEAATNGSALGRVIWKQVCDEDASAGAMKFQAEYPDKTLRPQSSQPFVTAMDDPSFYLPPGTTPTPDYDANTPTVDDPNLPTGSTTYRKAMPTVTRATPTGPSYPVFLDPVGWQSNLAVSVNGQPGRQHRYWLPTVVGAGRTWRIPRRTLYVRNQLTAASQVTWNEINAQPQRLFKMFSLMDDMTFELNGLPKFTASAANQVERQGRYTWAYLIRRPNNSDRTTVDITTVVYSGRSLDVPSQETAFRATGVSGTKGLAVEWGAVKPAVRRGQWVLDATLWDVNGNLAPQGHFYRVVNVDDTTAGSLAMELQTPLLGGPSTANARTIIVMDNVVEVFTRTDVTPTSPPLPY